MVETCLLYTSVLVLCSEVLAPLSLVRCYPIGVITMQDQGKMDEKIIAIPFEDPTYNTYRDISGLPSHIFSEMRHFFSVYKNCLLYTSRCV